VNVRAEARTYLTSNGQSRSGGAISAAIEGGEASAEVAATETAAVVVIADLGERFRAGRQGVSRGLKPRVL
jgi:hypothetical protein